MYMLSLACKVWINTANGLTVKASVSTGLSHEEGVTEPCCSDWPTETDELQEYYSLVADGSPLSVKSFTSACYSRTNFAPFLFLLCKTAVVMILLCNSLSNFCKVMFLQPFFSWLCMRKESLLMPTWTT